MLNICTKLYSGSQWGNVFDSELFSEIPFCPTEGIPNAISKVQHGS